MKSLSDSRVFICGMSAVAVSIALGAGCQRPSPPEYATAETIPHQDLTALWEASLSVLRKHDFTPERQDLAAGVITTAPTTSQQWFEFWRQDVADLYAFAHASVHTDQRRVTVRFRKEEAGGEWLLDVRVDVFQLSTPEYQVTSASSAIQSFSGLLPTVTGQVPRKGTDPRTWVPLGRDGAMESRLLSQILSEAGRFSGAESDTVEMPS